MLLQFSIFRFCQHSQSLTNDTKKQKKAQADLQLPLHCLIEDLATRSKADMPSRCIKQQEAIRQVLVIDRALSHLLPTWQESDIPKAINQALVSLNKVTNLLSGEKCVTVSMILAMLNVLQYIKDEVKRDESASRLSKQLVHIWLTGT